MKTSNPPSFVAATGVSRWAVLRIGAFLGLGAVWLLQASDGGTEPPLEPPLASTTNPPPAIAVVVAPAAAPSVVDTNAPSIKPLSPLVQGVIKLADAGVAPAVIETFVESSPRGEPLNEAEVIALKEHNVPDELVTLLLKTGAERQALKQQEASEAVARALAARRSVTGGLDPESYEYFQYYYLQPRAAASAQRRLAPWFGPRRFFPHGMAPGSGFRHHGSGRGQWR